MRVVFMELILLKQCDTSKVAYLYTHCLPIYATLVLASKLTMGFVMLKFEFVRVILQPSTSRHKKQFKGRTKLKAKAG